MPSSYPVRVAPPPAPPTTTSSVEPLTIRSKFVLNSAVLSEEMVLLAVESSEAVEVESEVTLLFVLPRLLVTLESELFVFERPLVSVSMFPIAVDNELFVLPRLLVTLESELFVFERPLVSVSMFPIAVDNELFVLPRLLVTLESELFVFESPLVSVSIFPIAVDNELFVLPRLLFVVDSPVLIEVESAAMLTFALATSVRKRLKVMSVPSANSTFSMPLHLVRSIAARMSSSSMLWSWLPSSVDSAPARVEITTVSRPEPPEMKRLAKLFRSAGLEILMTNRSLPAPPSKVDALYPPSKTRVSLPMPPTRVLEPRPPSRLSLPDPPKRLSSPAPPTRVSLPAPPLIVSLPPPPVIELADALPEIELADALPMPLATVPPRTRFSTFAARV